MLRCFSVGLVACLVASSAFAGVTAFTAVPVDNSLGGAPLANFATTDIKIDFTGQYTVSEILVNLAPGQIYQDATGGKTPPNGAFVGIIPSLGFDTFVAQGSATANGPFQDPGEIGGAVDLGGAAAATFTDAKLDYAWGPAGGNNILDQSGFLIARLSIAKSVNAPLGSVIALASAAGANATIQGSIVDGAVVFPGGVDAPVIAPLSLSNPDSCLNCSVNGMVMLDPSSDPADSFGGTISFLGYNPDFGAPASASGKNLDPVWDAAQQKFTWDTTGSTRGTYQWQVSASNAGGEGLGVITVEQHAVPEPATLALVGLALVGLAGCRRQK